MDKKHPISGTVNVSVALQMADEDEPNEVYVEDFDFEVYFTGVYYRDPGSWMQPPSSDIEIELQTAEDELRKQLKDMELIYNGPDLFDEVSEALYEKLLESDVSEYISDD